MASQNVTVAGASYTAVPAVLLPKTGGGTARFTDTSDATVDAANMIDGYTAYGADGTLITGALGPMSDADIDAITGGGGGGSITQDANGYIVLPSTGGGGGGGWGGATQHTIHLEFSDSSDTDIDVYYDDSLIGTMITSYDPSTWTYGSKTVTIADLDGVEWYNKTVTWTTLFDGTTNSNADSPYNYFWISDLSDVYPTDGSAWRITLDSTEYLCTGVTATTPNGNQVCVGNPKYSGGTDNGSSAPFSFYNAGWGAWVGDTEVSAGSHTIKIEQQA